MIALIEKVRGGNDLSAFDVQEAAAFLLSDSIEAKTKADFLTVLHEKGESASEIASFVRVLIGARGSVGDRRRRRASH